MKACLTDLFLAKRQFILYALIGASGAALDFLVFALLAKWGGLHYQVANAIGYASGTLWSFVLNARFNFKASDWLLLRLLAFCAVAAAGWACSVGVLYLTVAALGLDKYLAKAATIFVVVLLQYNLNRLVSFRPAKPPPNA